MGPTVSHSPALQWHRWLIVLAALGWSTSGLFAKSPAFEAWPADMRGGAQAFWRAVFACAVLLPLVRRPKWSWAFLPMTAAFVVMNYTYLTAMAHTSAANAIWLQMTAPLWVFLVGVFVFREPARRLDLAMLALAMLGVAIILACELPRGNAYGNLLALLSGVCHAVVVLSLRQLRGHDAFWLVFLNHAATAACLAPWAFRVEVFPPAADQWLLLALLGVVQLGLPYVLFTIGLRSVPGHEATGLALLEPVLLPLWVLLMWKEVPAWWTLLGACFILAGLVVRYAARDRA